MGIWESALILLGIGIISQRFKAGVGLAELGVGIRELAGAPLGGLGTGMGEFGTGLRTFAESLGDIGRGFGELFKNIPGYGGGEGFGGNGAGTRTGLLTVSGGDKTTQLAGGGGNVPTSPWTSQVLAESWVAGAPLPGMETKYLIRQENGWRYAPLV